MNKLAGVQTTQTTTFLGFDYGEKYIGIALGNSLLQQASPLTTLPNRGRNAYFIDIKKLIDTWQATALVIGLPLYPDGCPHAITEQALRFGRRLCHHFELPVLFVDERYSSLAAASDIQSSREKNQTARSIHSIDAMAARVILQQYFDQPDSALLSHEVSIAALKSTQTAHTAKDNNRDVDRTQTT